jgi:CheY-like chemotaxis protein
MNVSFPKNILVRTLYPNNLQLVLGDTTQLHQVLLNLCVNARDAMPNGGTLTLEAENVDIDATFAGAVPEAKPGAYVVWRISDTGTGIPPEILDRIFEPFFSTKGPDKGTGLGLSTVIGIVKSHNGFIRVYSKPGQGSIFTIYLPASISSSGDSSLSTKSEANIRGNGETILVVDDEAAVRQIARTVLTALNFQVVTAADGTEALVKVAEKRAELRAVITDMHMPHMDGLTFVRVLKHMVPAAGIIVSSGRLDEREGNEFKTLGVTALLGKPFTQEKLIEALKTIFKK